MRRKWDENRRSIGPAFYKNVRAESLPWCIPFDSGESIEMSFSRGTPPGAEWICSGGDIPILVCPVCPSRVLMLDRVFVLLNGKASFSHTALELLLPTPYTYSAQNSSQKLTSLFPCLLQPPSPHWLAVSPLWRWATVSTRFLHTRLCVTPGPWLCGTMRTNHDLALPARLPQIVI